MSMRDNDELRRRIARLEEALSELYGDFDYAAVIADLFHDSIEWRARSEEWRRELAEMGVGI